MKFYWLSMLMLTTASAFATPAHQTQVYQLFFANGAVQAKCTWTQGPQTPAESLMSIEWINGTTLAPAEPPGTFGVALFMPGMGHGSAPTQAQRILDKDGQPAVGAYLISNMYFTMGGMWQVNVTLNYADGTKEMKTIDVDVPAAANGGHHH